MPTVIRWSIGLALILATSVAPSAAVAQIDKCQASLAKNSQKLETQLSQGFGKCLSAIRKNQVKGKAAAASAAACEKGLSKVLGIGSLTPTKTKIGKFLTAIKKLETGGVCTGTELRELGHPSAGLNAPGVGPTDFVASWLAVTKQNIAWVEHLMDNGDARDLIDLVLAAGPVDGDPTECDASSGKGCGTDCTGAPPSGYAYRPNLCALSPANWPQCRVHACNLKATGARLEPLGADITFANRKFALEVCKVPSALPISGTDYVFLAGGPMSTFSPPPSVPIVPAVTWCIDQVRAEGWCDCTGQGLPFSPQSCLDHAADAGGSCPADGAALETDCVCNAPLGQSCKAANCTSCVNAKTGARCHPGTSNSAINTIYTGASVAGSCLYMTTMQFRFLSPGTCVDVSGNVIGRCSSVGAATAPCAALGGTSCVDSLGVDGVACTADDVTPPESTVTIPMTTGTAQATIENYINSEGVCTAPASHSGMKCVTNADCDIAPGSGSCGGFFPGCFTGPNPEDCRHTTTAGAGISCTQLKAGNLANFALSGILPAVDAPPGLSDYNMRFRFDCN